MRPIEIPKSFYIDHQERDLPAPPVLKENSRKFVIDADHPEMDELIDDARHYAFDGNDAPFELKQAAKALIKAVERSTVPMPKAGM